MTATQTELFSLTAESFDAPLSDWDWENRNQPVQERSIEDWRSVFIDRARETRPQKLGTIAEQSLTKTVPNRKLKHALPSMYQDWHKAKQYWKFKPYINGERKTFHLHENYDRAVAIGKKIMADLEAT